MNREFKRDLNNNYMILSDEAINNKDDYRVRMLISNKIPFLLKCNVRKFDGAIKYYYEITSKHPVNRVFEKKKIRKTDLNILITSFLKVLESSTEYLLNPNDFILEPEYIYMNIETNQVFFSYMPGYEKDISKTFHELTSYILEKIDHEDKHTVATAYELYRQTMNDNYSLPEILSSITGEDEKSEYNQEEERAIKVDNSQVNITAEEDKEEHKSFEEIKSEKKPIFLLGVLLIISALALLSYFLYVNLPVIKTFKIDNDFLLKSAGVLLIIVVIIIYSIYKKYELKKEKDNENLIVVEENKKELQHFDTEVKDNTPNHSINLKQEFVKNETTKEEEEELNYGNTVLLNYRVSNRKLISSKEKYKSFELTDKTFLIGKMQEHVDGVIHDELISRIHAEVRKDDSRYYLTDLNSTNGTFHNEKRLEANETVEIHPEDVIRFAGIEYVFR